LPIRRKTRISYLGILRCRNTGTLFWREFCEDVSRCGFHRFPPRTRSITGKVDLLANFNQQIIEEFRANHGKVSGPFEGKKMLLLHSTGRKSGKEYVTPLRYFDIDGQRVIVGSAAGADSDPQWFRNAIANPDVTIELGDDTIPVHCEVIGEPARSAYWEAVVEDDPGFGEYPKKTSRTIPLIALV